MEKKQGIGFFEKYLSLWVVWALSLTPKICMMPVI